ncbi:choline dehydrogenase [Verticillium alfalfae VaMs.102]|uniref:Choline dehydrogenase n=1 Tax=Verticillium alfalfae (strain VaMs.102 / ATCC MYA-4576 / FGSC 10136) TaxID=526221 RepID=C9SA76_VERA1|nr:choline dehydrogenase [Verticillium alfalfae VaMs.102]EEY16289.1 choline dehydrogenase [Verticillium alfalfae VaMs.102]
MEDFDFIVVGDGPSAVTIAQRLASSSSRPSVLHLQAWHAQRPDGTAPAVDPCSWSQPLMSTPQAHLGGRALSLAAGHALGGASTSDAYLDAWAESVGDASYRASGQGARSEPQHVFAGHTKPPNLTVDCLSQPDRIIFDGKKATGISTSNGTVHASKEILLCAGALRTPQLLLLSGIGPRDHLAALGIPLVCALPIGKALKDSLMIPVLWEVGPAFTDSADWLFDPETMRAHIRQFLNLETNLGKDHPSLLPIVSGQSDAVLDSKDIPTLSPRSQDLIRHPATSHWEFCVLPTGGSPNSGRRLLQINAYPQVVCSTGSLQLASKDAADPPLVDPNYLSQAIDRQNAVDAVRMVTRFFAVLASLSNDILGPHSAPASDDEADVLAFIKESAATARHYSGATPMRTRQDEQACVDADFCVLGVEGLRVTDLSVTPLLPVICSQITPNILGSILAEKLIQKHSLE